MCWRQSPSMRSSGRLFACRTSGSSLAVLRALGAMQCIISIAHRKNERWRFTLDVRMRVKRTSITPNGMKAACARLPARSSNTRSSGRSRTVLIIRGRDNAKRRGQRGRVLRPAIPALGVFPGRIQSATRS
jgi:hypothetical protein